MIVKASSSVAPTLRFGVFELDPKAGELRKRGMKIRLQGQPVDILVMLLQRPGETVTREELQENLWPADTFVDFEQGLNNAMKRLRAALDDDAESPHFIETLPRRGYRFIAPVETWQPESAASIAVLPFANIDRDTENEYFSDGLAEELINKLAQIHGLRVVARTSAFAFKGKQEDIRKIADVLGVANIVEGSVRKVGSRVRVTAQLIAAKDGTQLWSERYDREMADIFAIQEEIAQAIASALRVHFTRTSMQHIPRIQAYDAYLKARYCLAAFTRESLPRSREFYEQAIATDAGFAPAYSGLAMALVTLVLPGISPARTYIPLARAAAERALDIDPTSQEAHAVLGMVAALYHFDWEEAERRFRLAMSSNPVPAYVRWYYSYSYLLPMARSLESVQQCARGLQDDPLNFIGGFHYAGALLAGGDAEAGETHLRQLSEVHSNLHQPHYLLALSQAVRGLHKEAITAAERAYCLAPWSTTTSGLFAGLLRYRGDSRRAEQLRQELLPGDQYGAPMGLSLFHMGCSELEQAAEWAEKAIEQRDTRMILLIAFVRALRRNVLCAESRWSAIFRTLGIPPALEGD